MNKKNRTSLRDLDTAGRTLSKEELSLVAGGTISKTCQQYGTNDPITQTCRIDYKTDWIVSCPQTSGGVLAQP